MAWSWLVVRGKASFVLHGLMRNCLAAARQNFKHKGEMNDLRHMSFKKFHDSVRFGHRSPSASPCSKLQELL